MGGPIETAAGVVVCGFALLFVFLSFAGAIALIVWLVSIVVKTKPVEIEPPWADPADRWLYRDGSPPTGGIRYIHKEVLKYTTLEDALETGLLVPGRGGIYGIYEGTSKTEGWLREKMQAERFK